MAITFGCTTTASSYGVSQTQGSEATAEIAQARSAVGLVTNEQAYSRTVKSRATVLLDGAAPSAGASITIFGNTGLCESVNVTETNTNYKQAEIVITKADSATQVALA